MTMPMRAPGCAKRERGVAKRTSNARTRSSAPPKQSPSIERDGEAGQALDRREHLLPEACELVGLHGGEALHLRHVGAGGEEPRLAGAEDAAMRRRRRSAMTLAQLAQRRRRQQVHPAVIEHDLGPMRRMRDAEPRHQRRRWRRGSRRPRPRSACRGGRSRGCPCAFSFGDVLLGDDAAGEDEDLLAHPLPSAGA